jgi:hypothetical protein
VQRGLSALVMFQIVKVLEEEGPGGLLGVIEFGGAAGLFPEDVIDVFECLLEHRNPISACGNQGGFTHSDLYLRLDRLYCGYYNNV